MKRTSWIAVLALVFTTTVGAVPPDGIPWRGPVGEPGGPHVPSLCVTPWGVDLCALTGIEAAFIMPYGWGYKQPAPMGSWWRHYYDGWLVNAPGGLEGLPLAYPDWYTPLHEDPALDFVAKLVQVRVVVDPGLPFERAFRIEAPEVGFLTAVDYWGAGAFLSPLMDGGTFIFFRYVLPPMPPGVHVFEVYFTVSAAHCDGFLDIAGEPDEDHCVPAGETRTARGRFEFAPQ